MTSSLSHRHIQNFSDDTALEHHWGYTDRVIPCKSDAGSCQYLDVVYHVHDLGMLYSGILWSTLGAIVLIWWLARRFYISREKSDIQPLDVLDKRLVRLQSKIGRLTSAVSSFNRRWLSQESLRPIFGHATRVQVFILMMLIIYLTIWTFVGISYHKWITPVKTSTLHNTRTSLGPFSDRVGLLAYALMPFAIMLSSRESIISLLTGIPYHHFNFLHRWLDYIIFAQSVIHTVGWTVIETALYQPQPNTGQEWIRQRYMVWGVVAQTLVTLLFITSLSPIVRLTGYEFFRKAHHLVATRFIGACWAHWSKLACFMIASLAVWFFDRGVRLVKMALLHCYYMPDGNMGFTSVKAKVTHFQADCDDSVVRLEFEHAQDAWGIGQHFYLCFPDISIWQSHPFTPASLPFADAKQKQVYLIRSKQGQTKNLARLPISKHNLDPTLQGEGAFSNISHTTPVILAGPYGSNILTGLGNHANIICVAGDTGITYILPILLSLVNQRPTTPDRRIELVWDIRISSDANWTQSELATLEKAAESASLNIQIFITRECCNNTATKSSPEVITQDFDPKFAATVNGKELALPSSSSSAPISSGSRSKTRRPGRPNLPSLVASFVENTIQGSTTVFASGPSGMISDVRDAVALSNDPVKVWKGQSQYDVKLISDDRLE